MKFELKADRADALYKWSINESTSQVTQISSMADKSWKPKPLMISVTFKTTDQANNFSKETNNLFTPSKGTEGNMVVCGDCGCSTSQSAQERYLSNSDKLNKVKTDLQKLTSFEYGLNQEVLDSIFKTLNFPNERDCCVLM